MGTKQKQKENLDNNNLTRFPLDASFQVVRRLLALAFNNTAVTASNPVKQQDLKKQSHKIFSSKSKYN